MNIFKKYNTSILEQDACFTKFNMSATKLNGEQKFFCGIVEKKLTLDNPGDN